MLLRAYLGIVATVCIWGANVVALKALLAFFGAPEMIAVRFAFAGVLLVLLSVVREGWPRWDARTWLTVIGVGLLGNALFQALFLESIERSPAGIAGLGNALAPVGVVVFGLAVGKRPTARQGLGVAVSLGGMLWLFAQTLAPGSVVTPLGMGFLVLASAVWAIYTLANRPLGAKVGALPFVAFSLALGGLPSVLIGLPPALSAQAPPLAWGGLLLSALLANVFAYLAWANGVKTLGAARTAVWQNLAPIVSLGLGAALLGERLTAGEVGAALVVLAGVGLTNWPEGAGAATGAAPLAELVEPER